MDPNPFRRRTFRWPWRSRAVVVRDVDDELQFHVDMRTEELRRQGLSSDDARREAVNRFGDLHATRRFCVAQGTRKEDRVRRGIMFDEFLGDVVIGFRRLWKARSVAAAALITLALGIGANTAVFSLVNAALLRPLPYADADRLVVYFEALPGAGQPKMGVSPSDYLDFARDQRTSENLAIFYSQNAELTGGGTAERITATRVSESLFPLLGVPPALGRTLVRGDDQPDAAVAVISHDLWQRRFDGRADAIGATIMLDRRAHVVVGVMPRDFQFPLAGLAISGRPGDVWVPFAMTDTERTFRGAFFRNGVIGRLKPGVTIDQARAELPVLVSRTLADYPVALRGTFENMAGGGLEGAVAPLRDEVVGSIRLPLLVLLVAVALVLLVACANVANLLLSRAAMREREIAVMASLGASRGRIRRMLLTESLVLAVASGAAGLAVAWAATKAAPLALPQRLASLGSVSPDARVLGFTLLLSVVTALAFGLVPAAACAKADLQQALGSVSRGTTGGRGRLLFQRGLVVVAITLSTVLLVGAGLLTRSFSSLLQANVGSRTDRVLTATVTLPAAVYGSAERIRNFERALLERARGLPDVLTASVSSGIPLVGTDSMAFAPDDSPLEQSGEALAASVTWPYGDFFAVHGIPLKRGRLFGPHDRAGGERVLIVSESLATRVWPGQDPIGKRLKWGMRESQGPWMTVVGVVGDVKEAALDADASIHLYEPWEQLTDGWMGRDLFRTMIVSVRTGGDPRALAAPLRGAIRELDPALAVADLGTMDDRVAAASSPQRMSAVLMAGFAAAALLMAVVGLYGILAYGVAQRRREIGVRVAMGARPRDIIAPLVKQGGVLTAIGLGIGMPCALGLVRLIETLLYRTPSYDALTLVAVPIVLGTTSLLASYVPARRAARLDPVRALRAE